MAPDPHPGMMENLPHYKSKYEAAKKVNVYYVPAFDSARNIPVFFYAIASAMLHEQMSDCIRKGFIPEFAVIVEKGEGVPTSAVKEKMKAYYGFDHDFHASNDNSTPPAGDAKIN